MTSVMNFHCDYVSAIRKLPTPAWQPCTVTTPIIAEDAATTIYYLSWDNIIPILSVSESVNDVGKYHE